MDCPRGEEPMARYSDGEREAVVCEECGFLDVPADHRYQVPTIESWTEAMERHANGKR
jgi:hypothetical protein